MYKLVIFDLDGTLLNTITDLAEAGNAALRSLGLREHPEEAYKTFVGEGVYKLIERALPKEYRTTDQIKALKGVFDAYYAEHSLDHTKPYDGILELLSLIQKRGIDCAVASNKPHIYTNELVKLMFKDKIAFALGQREGIPTKPDPAIIREILQYFNTETEACLYVGDSDVDMYTAKNAGIRSVGVSWGFRTEKELLGAGADIIVHSVKALEEVILRS